MLEYAGFLYALIAGLTAVLLMLYAIEKRDERLFLFSLGFLIVSWSGFEWSLYLAGHNLFDLVFAPMVPLASFFVLWCLFVIYVAERYFRRRVWVGFLAVVFAIIIVAHFCMNCLFA